MKRKTKIKLIFLAIILVIGITLYFTGFINDLKIKTINYFENTLNRTGLELLKGKGSLINQSDIKNLEDSKITGEDLNINTTENIYYSILESKEKKLYKQIYANMQELGKSFIPVVELNKDEINDSIEAVYNDHPELFWINTNYTYKYLQSGKVVQITLSYNSTSKNLEESKNIFNTNLNEIVETANTYKNDYEKEKYVHDYLIENNEYNEDAKLNQSAYSAIVNNETVCAGYSRAFQLIMNKLGITTYYITGDSSGDHAWNIIELNNEYYNVDLTWDDQKTISYKYFNVPDSIFSKTHIRKDLSIYLPVCRGTDYYNYEEKQKIAKNNKKAQEELEKEQENNKVEEETTTEEEIESTEEDTNNEDENTTTEQNIVPTKQRKNNINYYYDEEGNLVIEEYEETEY